MQSHLEIKETDRETKVITARTRNRKGGEQK
jgi:hypothetical protein